MSNNLQARKKLPNQSMDRFFTFLVQFAAIFIFIALSLIIVVLFLQSLPSIKEFGFSFLYTKEWSSPRDQFGALIPIYGTLITSLIAIIIAVPISIFTAFFLAFLGNAWLRSLLKVLVELLAAVPSIIFGIFGLMILAPYMADYFQMPLQEILVNIPFVGALVDGPAMGIGLLPAGIILGIMIIPYITSVITDVFKQAPVMLVESAYGLGCTTWETLWNIVVPYSRSGIISAVMLGLGRALGETMAVTFIVGNAFYINGASLYSPGNTITSVITNEFSEADSTLHSSALLELALLLFAITLVVIFLSKLMVKVLSRNEGN